ncbi:MAG: FAD-dependent oxidoreductase [Gemmatimonadales bacterium]|jgi:thioredoxin reductase (NADPH)|nr:FAD-dependent oxidoreductase [Gemmatimonadales bacterium]
MSKPIILTLDDDPHVLRAVERDLRAKYGEEYRIARADSGAAALELLVEWKRRGRIPALFLVDQRMPGMTGLEFLAQASVLFPDARRVLLTAYADTDAAIAAINQVHLDHYLLKPWDPPEEKLYPLISDLLDDWQMEHQPAFDGIRVVGHPWTPDSFRVKDFLARNHVPYVWMDVVSNSEAQELLALAKEPEPALPMLFFSDGTTLGNPSNRAIADRIGIQTVADQPLYDLLVVGAGPAGLAAAVYGASEGLRTLVVEEEAPGGQAGMSSRIENYLGFPTGISGAELARRAVAQARRFGVEILTTRRAKGLNADGPTRVITLEDGTTLNSRAVLIATGVSYRELQAKGIADFTGAGVYYGAAMGEGESVRDQDVYVIGGANSAGQAAMYFARFAKTVTMLVRGPSLAASMSQYLIDQIGSTANIRVWTRSEVREALGTDRLTQLVVTRDGGQRSETVEAAALFIFIGAEPRTDWLGDLVARDAHGFVLSGAEAIVPGPAAEEAPSTSRTSGAVRRLSVRTGRRSSVSMRALRVPDLLETSVPGVFVAGDVRAGSVKRVASAVGEGAMAVMYVHQYLRET